jgi:hypothetical protein
MVQYHVIVRADPHTDRIAINSVCWTNVLRFIILTHASTPPHYKFTFIVNIQTITTRLQSLLSTHHYMFGPLEGHHQKGFSYQQIYTAK